MIIGALVQKFIFGDGSSGHFGFGPQSSNLGSQRIVTAILDPTSIISLHYFLSYFTRRQDKIWSLRSLFDYSFLELYIFSISLFKGHRYTNDKNVILITCDALNMRPLTDICSANVYREVLIRLMF